MSIRSIPTFPANLATLNEKFDFLTPIEAPLDAHNSKTRYDMR